MPRKRISINLMLLVFIFLMILVAMYCIIKYNIQKKYNEESKGKQVEQIEFQGKKDGQEQSSEQEQKAEEVIETASSSKIEPINVGQWGKSTKKAEDGTYKEVEVRVSKVIRGTEAEKIIKNFSEINKEKLNYTAPVNNMEWAVIEYEANLKNMNANENGNTSKILLNVEGIGNNTSVKYKNKIYNITVLDLNKDEYKMEEIVTGRYATQLPIGCTDYTIIIGDDASQRAFIKGE